MTTPPLAPLRLFLALWPSSELAARLQQCADAWEWSAGARRTRPERLHVTLHFIGEVAAAEVLPLQHALDVRWPGCELALDQAQVWPGGIAVLEASRVPPALAALHEALAHGLRERGLAVESRRFRPHVTFARKAQGSQPPAGFTPLRWSAGTAYLLVQSLPGGRGYRPLQRFG